MKKKKMGLVMGDSGWLRLADSFKFLNQKYDVSLYLPQKEGVMLHLPRSLKSYLFHENKSVPGFLQHAEKKLAKEDIMISIDFGSSGSLQAFDVAKRHNIPLLCYVGSYDFKRYHQHPNVENITRMMIDYASGFIVPVPEIAEKLKTLSVRKNKITLFPPLINQDKFADNPKKRADFRKYIGMDNNDIVIIYYGPLVRGLASEDLIKAFKLQSVLNPDFFSAMKVIFVGDGEYMRDLQYLAYQLGAGGSTFFLSQDAEPFLSDLFCASDLLVADCPENGDFLPIFPYHVLEAMSCGSIPLLPEKSVLHSSSPDSRLLWQKGDYESMAYVISRVTKNHASIDSWKRLVGRYVSKHSGREKAMVSLETLIEQVMQTHAFVKRGKKGKNEQADIPRIPWGFLEQYSGSSDKAQEVLRILEQIGGAAYLSPDEQSLLSLYKGNALKCLLRYDEALLQYKRSLQLNSDQVQAVSSMGFISWYSHNHEEALTWFKRGLALAPGDHSCMLGVGLVYKRLGMAEEALHWLECCVLSGGKSGFALQALIQACNECKDRQQGISTLERVVEMLGEQEALMNGLGNLYLQAGQTEEAYRIFARFLISGTSP